MAVPRMRLFAGPNGSGKSTLKAVIPEHLLGVYLNPDDLERDIRRQGDRLDLRPLHIQTSADELRTFFRQSTLLAALDRSDEAALIGYDPKGIISFANLLADSYVCSVLTDFLRRKLLDAHRSFTFESVMSSPDKLDLLTLARQQYGFRTYLYYVSTEDPAINRTRVQNRVRAGGHGVPDDKIVSRYYRSLEYLLDAIRRTDRAFLFDNSGPEQVWVAEITDGRNLTLQTNRVPTWVQRYVLDKL